MNRYLNIFLAAIFCSASAFAQTTNFNFVYIGDGTDDLLYTNEYFAGSGEYPTNNAAYITNVASLTISGATTNAVIPTNQTKAVAFTGGGVGEITIDSLATNVFERLENSGGAGLVLIDAASVAVTNSAFLGGQGGEFTIVKDDDVIVERLVFNGGAGFYLDEVASIVMTNSSSTFIGGAGGKIANSQDYGPFTNQFQEVNGGHGIELNGDYDLLLGGVAATGGDGGTINSVAGRGEAFGGDGVSSYFDYLQPEFGDATVANITVSGGTYQGGNGGTANYSSDGLDETVWDDDYFDNLDGARGGNGMRVGSVYNWYNGERSGSVTISGGSFAGGDGGTAKNTGTGPVNAGGGHGLLANHTDILISGGTFTGGAGGTENGVDAEDGYGVRTRDSNLEVTGGTIGAGGRGLYFESHYLDSTADVSGGTFGDSTFVAIFDEEGPGTSRTTTINISGGTFSGVEFVSDAVNNATLTGGSLGTLSFDGVNVNNISLTNVTGAGNVTKLGAGTVNVSQWDDANFKNVTILDGTMNFDNQRFNLLGTFTWQPTNGNATVNFNEGLTVKSGGVLRPGLTAVQVSEVEIETGGKVVSMYDAPDGTNFVVGSINTTGDLNIGTGVEWEINVGTNLLVSGTDFEIATALGALTNGMTDEDIVFSGDGYRESWLDLIGLTNSGSALTASYNLLTLNEGLDVETTNVTTSYEKAVDDFTRLVPQESEAFELIAYGIPDAAAAGVLISNSYVRTAETAGSLSGLQAVFTDQVTYRIRSRMQYENAGGSGSYSPRGALGWDGMRDLSDRLESGVSTDGMRDLSDRLESGISTDGMRDLSDQLEGDYGSEQVQSFVDSLTPEVEVDSKGVPVEWQAWGGGYGAGADQDDKDQFSGYKSSVGGGLLGVDKRINNILLGIGGGYARTSVEGYTDKDAQAHTGHGVGYFSAQGDRAFLDISGGYAFNAVDTEYDVLDYTGEFNAHTLGLYIGGGYTFTLFETVLLTPEASLLNTLYWRDDYTESSSIEGMPDMVWDQYDQWSHLSKLGATLSTTKKIDFADMETVCRPELRAHWLHEFNAEMDDENYRMVLDGVQGIHTIGVPLMAREEDMIKLGAGIRLSKWSSDTTEVGFDIDGTFGSDYDAFIVSGRIMHRF